MNPITLKLVNNIRGHLDLAHDYFLELEQHLKLEDLPPTETPLHSCPYLIDIKEAEAYYNSELGGYQGTVFSGKY